MAQQLSTNINNQSLTQTLHNLTQLVNQQKQRFDNTMEMMKELQTQITRSQTEIVDLTKDLNTPNNNITNELKTADNNNDIPSSNNNKAVSNNKRHVVLSEVDIPAKNSCTNGVNQFSLKQKVRHIKYINLGNEIYDALQKFMDQNNTDSLDDLVKETIAFYKESIKLDLTRISELQKKNGKKEF